jgi:hypothetical protein
MADAWVDQVPRQVPDYFVLPGLGKVCSKTGNTNTKELVYQKPIIE